MRGILKLLEGLFLFGLVVVFIKWFVKGLFGRYFILFWIWLIAAFVMYFNHKAKVENEYDHRTGAEIWESKYGKVR